MNFKQRSFKAYLLLLLKGMAMGAADVVPGVSGGTIAFISGIYDELLDALRALTPANLKLLLQGRPTDFWQVIHGNFLVVLGLGAILSLLTISRLVTYLMAHHPVQLWSFFVGLIIASVIYMVRQQVRWGAAEWLGLVIGAAIALAISVARPTTMGDELHWVFLAGAVAICATLLPGISGSSILLLMGMYPVFLAALNGPDFVILATLAAGCATGLLCFSHILGWLLDHFRAATLSVLTGVLLGSINIIWPWKQVLETRVNSKGELVPLVQSNVLPGQFGEITGSDPHVIMALVCVLAGLILVLGLESLARPSENS